MSEESSREGDGASTGLAEPEMVEIDAELADEAAPEEEAAPTESDAPPADSAPASPPAERPVLRNKAWKGLRLRWRTPAFLKPVRAFLERHGRKLWWLHSLYALGLGLLVVFVAAKGFEHARWLTITLGLAWILMIALFRLFGSGSERRKMDSTGAKVGFYVMTYLLKNCYQGMLFFVLPFYWKATTFDSANAWFVILLCVCAFLSTMDVVFDEVLMRWRAAASVFYALTLFACLNLVIPALAPDTASLTTMKWAAALTVLASWFLHVPLASLKKPLWAAALLACLAGGIALAHVARTVIPPVPMHLSDAAVGPKLLKDGRLAMQVTVLHRSLVKKMHAVTDVVTPGGVGDRLYHVWRHEDQVVASLSGRKTKRRKKSKSGLLRLRSKLSRKQIPKLATGRWSVDVYTSDEQLVGRFAFTVIE